MAEIFDGTVKIRTITGLVAIAMVQQCDHDLTEVTYRKVHNDGWDLGTGTPKKKLGPEFKCCLRCFLREWAPTKKRVINKGDGFGTGTPYAPKVTVGVWSEVDCDPMESLMYNIDNVQVVVTSIALFPDGKQCQRCRKIP